MLSPLLPTLDATRDVTFITSEKTAYPPWTEESLG